MFIRQVSLWRGTVARPAAAAVLLPADTAALLLQLMQFAN